MGPCPFRHGYFHRQPADRGIGSALQWGHALSGMDTSNTMLDAPGINIASMGPCPFRHGYVLAVLEILQSVPASMGPCPFRHGYISKCSPICMPLESLQWGHALSGMDTSLPRQRNHPVRREASMGPCPFRHGYTFRPLVLMAARNASMGPCPFRHGYLPSNRSAMDMDS